MRRSLRCGLRLKYLVRIGHFRSGNPRMYFRRKGVKQIPMPDAPMDAPEFLTIYAACLSDTPVRVIAAIHPTGTIGAGVRAYLASDIFLTLAPSTRVHWRAHIERIEAAYGTGRMADLLPRHVRKDISAFGPNPANNRLKAWRSLGRFWLQCGFIDDDPCTQVRKIPAPRTDGHIPWTHADVNAFRSTWGTDTSQRLAFELLYRTCAAIGDACFLGPANVQDGWISYHRQKSGTTCMAPMVRSGAPPWFAFNADLETCLASHPRHMTYLTTGRGASKSVKSASQWFSAACRKAGLTVTAHGIRKFRAMQFRENGATVDERMAVLGHETEKMAAHYSKGADLKMIISGTQSANFRNRSAK